MSYRLSEEKKKRYFEEALLKIKENNHEYIRGSYENKSSVLIVFCPTHLEEVKTTFTNYCRSKTGTGCCGRKRVSDLLTDRQYSPETIKKMSQAATDRVRPATAGQDWRRTFKARQWEKQIDLIWDSQCAISGVETDLVRHHFFSGVRYKRDTFPLRHRYNSKNGILIQRCFHKDFHKAFGYEGNDITQFSSYIKMLETLIRSQIQQKFWEGSETRVDAPFSKSYFTRFNLVSSQNRNERSLHLETCLERVIKLHERLEKIRQDLLDS